MKLGERCLGLFVEKEDKEDEKTEATETGNNGDWCPRELSVYLFASTLADASQRRTQTEQQDVEQVSSEQQ